MFIGRFKYDICYSVLHGISTMNATVINLVGREGRGTLFVCRVVGTGHKNEGPAHCDALHAFRPVASRLTKLNLLYKVVHGNLVNWNF